jgi:hypothetical protein
MAAMQAHPGRGDTRNPHAVGAGAKADGKTEQKRIFWDDAWKSLVLSGFKRFLPLQNPPDFQLVADEMDRLHDFKRARSTVAVCAKARFAQMIPQPGRKPRTYGVSSAPMSANSGRRTARSTRGGPPLGLR